MRLQLQDPTNATPLDRRQLLRGVGAAAVLAGVGIPTRLRAAGSIDEPVVRKGRIRQSIAHWCFAEHWTVPETIEKALALGCQSVELVEPKYFPLLREKGLSCAIGQIDLAPDPPFVKGWNHPKYFDRVFRATRDSIDACSEFGYPNVIAFTGMSAGLTRKEGATNCVEGLKKIVGHAEKKNVTICLEVLNTRDDTHPMKGHPGYQGDDTEYVMEIIDRVGSSHLKLLFDVYHIQIMNGDLIRRIRQYHDRIGHVHVAGNPGRAEIGTAQEIQYPAVMQCLLDVGYTGYVGQEFLPTGDPLRSLGEAVAICDV